jgi:FkbM family methyltransferase
MGSFTSLLYRFVKGFWQILPAKRLWAHALRPIGFVRRKLYTAMPFKGTFTVKTSAGSFKLRNYGYGTIEKRLFWHGWEGPREGVSARLWVELAQRAHVIFDVGSNTGIYALSAAAVNGRASVHAFEPSTRVFKKLCHNIQLNGFGNVFAHELAVSDSGGEKTFYDVDSAHQHSASLERDMLDPSMHKEARVQSIRLDEFCRRENISRIDLIKIDVEMHEPQVLEGMGRLLDDRPAMLIEVLNDRIGEAITNRLAPLGYLFYNLDERSSPVLMPSVRKSANLNYLACQPQHASSLGLQTSDT